MIDAVYNATTQRQQRLEVLIRFYESIIAVIVITIIVANRNRRVRAQHRAWQKSPKA